MMLIDFNSKSIDQILTPELKAVDSKPDHIFHYKINDYGKMTGTFYSRIKGTNRYSFRDSNDMDTLTEEKVIDFAINEKKSCVLYNKNNLVLTLIQGETGLRHTHHLNENEITYSKDVNFKSKRTPSSIFIPFIKPNANKLKYSNQ